MDLAEDWAAEREEGRAARTVPKRLWLRLREDPARVPEHIALAAGELHAPAAARWVAETRARYTYAGRELARMAKRKHAAYARHVGAVTGLGGFITMAPDLAAVAWIQSRLVFFVAAAYGYDPFDRMRPAELLVLQRVYDDPLEARTALDGAGRTFAEAYVRSRLARETALIAPLMKMVGEQAAKGVAFKGIPILGAPLNAIADERATRALADRAMRFYGG